MCEMVKRNNAGVLGGQLFNVADGLIEQARELMPKWKTTPAKKIAKTIINGMPTYDLLHQPSDGSASRAIFTVPGGKKAIIPVMIMAGDRNPEISFDDNRAIKVTA
jgi:hypothetical protein